MGLFKKFVDWLLSGNQIDLPQPLEANNKLFAVGTSYSGKKKHLVDGIKECALCGLNISVQLSHNVIEIDDCGDEFCKRCVAIAKGEFSLKLKSVE